MQTSLGTWENILPKILFQRTKQKPGLISTVVSPTCTSGLQTRVILEAKNAPKNAYCKKTSRLTMN